MVTGLVLPPKVAYRRAMLRQDFKPEDPKFIMADIIGPKPSRLINPELDEALSDLERLSGLEKVKMTLRSLLVSGPAVQCCGAIVLPPPSMAAAVWD